MKFLLRNTSLAISRLLRIILKWIILNQSWIRVLVRFVIDYLI